MSYPPKDKHDFVGDQCMWCGTMTPNPFPGPCPGRKAAPSPAAGGVVRRVYVQLSYLKRASTGTIIPNQQLICTTEPVLSGESIYYSEQELLKQLSKVEELEEKLEVAKAALGKIASPEPKIGSGKTAAQIYRDIAREALAKLEGK